MGNAYMSARASVIVTLCLIAKVIMAPPAWSEELYFDVSAVAEVPIDSTVDRFMPPPSTDHQDAMLPIEETPWASSSLFLAEHGRRERLIDRVTDPTAWLLDVRIRQQWNWPVELTDPDSQAIQFRPTIPFTAWEHVNLLRVTVPYNLQSTDGAGLGDVEIFDLVVFEETWGRWGAGPSVRLVPQSGDNDSTFQAGPAAGAVTKTRHWTIGVLAQNFLGESASQSKIQPILAYKFDDRTSIGVGESEFRYEWDEATWSQIPLGIQADHIADVYGQKLQFFINPQYNFQRDSSNSGWTLYLGIVLLVPEA
jgi:hypothetical protein